MATVQQTYDQQILRVIHPLDDEPEEKCSAENLGPIEMTGAVRLSLQALRGYLIFMTVMLVYHVMDLAGFFHHGR